MAVPSKDDIISALRVPEVMDRRRGNIRNDVVTEAQQAVKNRLKTSWAAKLEEQLRKKASVKRTKWDV